jgi:hypothetical protein
MEKTYVHILGRVGFYLNASSEYKKTGKDKIEFQVLVRGWQPQERQVWIPPI